MKQVINRRGAIIVEDLPEPVCGPNDIKIAISHSLISAGTELRTVEITGQNLASRAKQRPDLVKKVLDRARTQGIMSAYRAVHDKLYEPKSMGYSAAGVVLETGANTTRYAPGDRVACGGASAAHAGVVCVPENLVVPIPAEVNPEHAAFATVASIAMQGVRRAAPQFGESFMIIGLGLVGQLCVQLARAAGVHVIGFDLARDRVDLAREHGADEAYVLSEVDPVEKVAEFTDGLGADAVIVAAATKSSDPMNLAMAALRERGRVAIVGVVGLELDWGNFYAKELDIVMSRSYGPGRYDADYELRGIKYPLSHIRWTENENMSEVLRLIARGRLSIAHLLTTTYPATDAASAYEELQTGDPKPLGVILTHERDETKPSPVSVKAPRTNGGLAVVGCGSFAKTERIPYLLSSKSMRPAMLVSRTAASVQQLAKDCKIAKATCDYADAIKDDAITTLLVAAPHSLHGPITLDAAHAGKDLIVEKPMAVTAAELEETYVAVRDAGIRYSMGFNRRFAPASVQLKTFRDALDEPCTVVYRANVGLVPPGSWMHSPEEGGGRIVGEACHFFDYCTWLCGAQPVSISATQMSYDGQRFAATDNLSAIVKYADGSTATIVYSTIGHADLGKERIEWFGGGKAAVLDDFTALTFHGSGTPEGWKGRVDKGHRDYVRALDAAIANATDFPIGLEDSYLAHRLTFNAIESARTGAVIAL